MIVTFQPRYLPKQVKIHLKLTLVLPCFCRKTRMLSAFFKLTTPPGISSEHKLLISPLQKPLVSILEKTSTIKLNNRGAKGSLVSNLGKYSPSTSLTLIPRTTLCHYFSQNDDFGSKASKLKILRKKYSPIICFFS
jgi:hypothetical protein